MDGRRGVRHPDANPNPGAHSDSDGATYAILHTDGNNALYKDCDSIFESHVTRQPNSAPSPCEFWQQHFSVADPVSRGRRRWHATHPTEWEKCKRLDIVTEQTPASHPTRSKAYGRT